MFYDTLAASVNLFIQKPFVKYNFISRFFVLFSYLKARQEHFSFIGLPSGWVLNGHFQRVDSNPQSLAE